MISLTAADIDAIASAVVAKMQRQPANGDVSMTRADAAKYLGVSVTTFDRMRSTDKLLRPVTEKPLRWSKVMIDQYRTRNLRVAMAAAV